MEIVVRKNDLLRELQLFQGIVERKNTIPILANVLMEAKGDQLQLLATDLEVGLRSCCAASISKEGSLPARFSPPFSQNSPATVSHPSFAFSRSSRSLRQVSTEA